MGGLISILTVVAAATALAEPPNTPATSSVLSESGQAEDVSFKSDGFDRMTVPVSVGGSGPYNFLVDTGADRTAVSSELADRLKLERSQTVRLHSLTGASQVATTALRNLRVTSEAITVARAPVLSEAHIGADGILGVDSLQSQRVLFDFKTNRMTVMPSALIVPKEEDLGRDAIVVTAKRKHGRLILSHARAENEAVRVVFDTGAQITVGNEALRRRLMRSSDVLQGNRVSLSSVTGERLNGEYYFLRTLEIGGIKLGNVAIVFADAHTFRQLNLNRKPAILLGMNAMRAFDRVSIDFANKKVRLLVPEHSSADGLRLAARLDR